MFALLDRDDVTQWTRKPGGFTGEMGRSTGYLPSRALVGYFDGISRFIEFLQTEMPQPQQERASSRNAQGNTFNAFNSYEETLDVFLNRPSSIRGFDESDVILRDEVNAGNLTEYDTFGDFLDIGRFLEGEPECFGQMVSGNPRGRRVNLIVNGSWPYFVEHQQIVARSRRVQRLVDWLESQQIRTSVLVVDSHQCGHIEVLVKDHDATLDMNDVAIVSHPEYLRRLIFRFNEHSKTWQPGYGSATALNQKMVNHPPYPDMHNEITVFVGNQNDINSINAEFDKLESWMVQSLASWPVEPDDRYGVVCLGYS